VAAEAELRSLQVRIAADDARYGRGPGHPDTLARSASQAERTAALATAEVGALEAEAALTAAKAKKDAAATTAAEKQLTAAKKMVETARLALAKDTTAYTPLSPAYPTTSTGRRRALAQWIANRDNPLTARVAVNHIWMRHFGRPLVETVSDFGRNGKKPTHPELLDWLAVEFMGRGWSMKHLHRLIVTSAAYRRASADRGTQTADADNRWLWGFPRRRMEAEAVRDSLLHVADTLDRALGGLDLDPDKDANSRRRGLYFTIHPEVGGHLQMLEMFDAPDPCDCYRRSESLVPQQALALTNSALIAEQSKAVATKLGSAGSDDAFIVAAFEQVLSRPPTGEETKTCQEFLTKQVALYRAAGAKPVSDPQLRARTSLVRALFNHNDFVTIR
jgi:hypothetical protein